MRNFVDPFEDMHRVLSRVTADARPALMPMDAYETEGTYTLRFDLPGVSPDNVDITVEKGTLTVTAQRDRESVDNVTWILRERPTGTHQREIHLGDRVATDDINAEFDGGVLTVTVPLREEAKPRKISINAGQKELSV